MIAKRVSIVGLLGLFACGGSTTAGTGAGGAGGSGGVGGGTTGGADTGGGGAEVCDDDTDLPMESLGGGDDPEAGDFTMAEALDGLPEGTGPLRAIIETELGTITCELYPDSAPIGVANFVGLARGRRPYLEGGEWIRGKRYYDGLIFHRVIDDFMAQGGDPLGTGFGGPGYEFVNEVSDTTHCEPSDPPDPMQPMTCHLPGTFSYANAGADTNGSQFFIVAEDAQPHLDGDYTAFGRCSPVDVVKAITEVTVEDEKPVEDVHTLSVTVTRCAL